MRLSPFVFALFSVGPALGGSVVTDGSLGATRTLGGPNYAVTPAMGIVRGTNLFQSLKTLYLSAGETATFSGPSTVTNVLARVTGGASNIDGTLRCTIPHADFYLINPAGVVFGSDASLDVGGSFAVTTADQIKLADGHIFVAGGASAAVLSSAVPAAFGFLSDHPTSVNVAPRATLAVAAGRSLAVASGGLVIRGGKLTAPGGRLDVVSVGGRGELTVDAATGSLGSPSGFTQLGDVTLTDNASLDASGPSGGAVTVVGRSMQVQSSTVMSDTLLSGRGQTLEVDLSGDLSLTDGGVISASTHQGGTGSDVAISAAGVHIDGSADQEQNSNTGIFARSQSTASGNGGNLTLNTGVLRITGGGFVSTSNFGSGDGGNLTIQSKEIVLDGSATPTLGTGIFANTVAARGGRAGNVTLKTDGLRVTASGEVSSNTFGSGNGGKLSIQARDIVLDGSATPTQVTGIIAGTGATGGHAGNVALQTGTLHVTGGGEVSSDTIGSGDGGNLSIQARDIVVTGSGDVSASTSGTGNGGDLSIEARDVVVDGSATPTQFTGIGASTQGVPGGSAGNLKLKTDTLRVTNSGEILANTSGSGNGGDLTIVAKDVVVDGSPAPTQSAQITSDTKTTNHVGHSENLLLRRDSLRVIGGGRASASTFRSGNAGDPTLQVRHVAADDSATSALDTAISVETDSAHGGKAGNLALETKILRVAGSGEVSASTGGSGNGGDLTINATDILVDGSATPTQVTGITAETQAALGGEGGNIILRADTLRVTGGGEVSAQTFGSGNGGDLTVESRDIVVNGSAVPTQLTEITTDTNATHHAGQSGTLLLKTDSLRVIGSGLVSASTSGSGNGGNLSIQARDIVVNGSATMGQFTGITAQSDDARGGSAGNLTLKTDTLRVTGSGEISASTFGSGNGGDLTVHAKAILVDGSATPTRFTGIDAETVAVHGGGSAGNITLQTDILRVTGRGKVSASTSGSGNGGNLTIQASDVVVDGSATPTQSTGIFATTSANHGGKAGSVTLNTDTLRVAGRGEVSTGTSGSGNGGDLEIDAKDVVVDGSATPTQFTGIDAVTDGTRGGRGGDVSLKTDRLSVTGSGAVSTSTDGSGNGGDLMIQARDVVVDGSATPAFSTAIIAQTYAAHGGKAGNLMLSVDALHLISRGEVSVATSGSGAGGNLTVDATTISIDGSALPRKFTGISAQSESGATGPAGTVNVYASGNIALSAGQITTSSAQGGNALNVQSQSQITLDNRSSISASAKTTGGNLSITAPSLISIAGTSRVTTNGAGDGGNLTIDTLRLSLDAAHGSRITANGGVNGGNLQLSADQKTNLQFRGNKSDVFATGQTGASGSIANAPSENDIASVAVLATVIFDNGVALAPTCGMQVDSDQSSFTLEGGNGLPPEPGEWNASFGGPYDLRP